MQTIYDGSFGRWYIDGNVMVDTAGKVHRSGIVRIDSEDVPLDSALWKLRGFCTCPNGNGRRDL